MKIPKLLYRSRRSPGGRTIRIPKLKRHAPKRCGLCGKALSLTRAPPPELRKLAKSEKRPQRIFGGVLCSACSERIVREAARLKHGVVSRQQLPISRLKWIDQAIKRVA